jgi:uncharacterized membrane-anchored protein
MRVDCGNAIRAIPFNADAAQYAAQDGQTNTYDQIDYCTGKMASKVRIEKDRDAGIDQHSEDISECAA